MHYGFLPDTHIMLPVCESGGVSLEWFKTSCMKDISFKEIDAEVSERGRNSILFLPYIVGTNSPEFDCDASGTFVGLRGEHDAFDMAYAVMEGVGFLLKKNCEYIEKNGSEIKSIIATGGGAKSDRVGKQSSQSAGCSRAERRTAVCCQQPGRCAVQS